MDGFFWVRFFTANPGGSTMFLSVEESSLRGMMILRSSSHSSARLSSSLFFVRDSRALRRMVFSICHLKSSPVQFGTPEGFWDPRDLFGTSRNYLGPPKVSGPPGLIWTPRNYLGPPKVFGTPGIYLGPHKVFGAHGTYMGPRDLFGTPRTYSGPPGLKN